MHYASPINFSRELMLQNKDNFQKLVKLINNAMVQLILADQKYKFEETTLGKEFCAYMDDNLDFANVVSLI
jgi:cysteinyl-tRNA synthetase